MLFVNSYVHKKFNIIGLYTREELNQMIYVDGYIPVASGAELNAIRSNKTGYRMGAGTIWDGDYTFSTSSKFVQVNNVSLSDYQSGEGWVSIREFYGTYDGNELYILDLVSAVDARINALFLNISNAYLRNIRIPNANITQKTTHSAILVGYALSTAGLGSIENVVVSGSITGSHVGSFTGGIVGANTNTSGVISGVPIINCHSDLNIEIVGMQAGGIVGRSSGAYAIIEDCSSDVNITNTSVNDVYNFGGIVGSSANDVIRCTAKVIINIGRGRNVGGVAGALLESAKMSQCKAFGSVTGNEGVGGLVGAIVGDGASIWDCKSSVSANMVRLYKVIIALSDSVGGLVGTMWSTATVMNSYSYGDVTLDKTARPLDTPSVGGLIGKSITGVTTNSYWDIETSGQATSAGGVGKTTAEMKAGLIPDTAIYVDWSSLIWDENGDDYPTLINI